MRGSKRFFGAPRTTLRNRSSIRPIGQHGTSAGRKDRPRAHQGRIKAGAGPARRYRAQGPIVVVPFQVFMVSAFDKVGCSVLVPALHITMPPTWQLVTPLASDGKGKSKVPNQKGPGAPKDTHTAGW